MREGVDGCSQRGVEMKAPFGGVRFSCSGIVRSNEPMPASTCTTGTPACAAASAPASVELLSPGGVMPAVRSPPRS
jgi:hypothetical protein